MNVREGGFTIVEMLMAVVVLSVGLIALVSSSATVTRMVGHGQTSTVASQVAARRLERLRSFAASTVPQCTSANFASGTLSTPVSSEMAQERWVVADGATAATRRVTVYVTYNAPGGRGTRADTVTTVISCIA